MFKYASQNNFLIEMNKFQRKGLPLKIANQTHITCLCFFNPFPSRKILSETSVCEDELFCSIINKMDTGHNEVVVNKKIKGRPKIVYALQKTSIQNRNKN